ncbi:MAG TPA: hypothetical protein VGI63_09650 [Verrucomicrobiae bacterium]|jgi:hypothetical protein
MISLTINCICGRQYACEVQPHDDQPAPVACPTCYRDGTPAVKQFLAGIRHRSIPVKIVCACGQKYSFDVQPVDGRMPTPVFCPICHHEGTAEANRIIASLLAADPRTLPPPSVNAVLNSVQSSLAPHLVNALKDAVVKELAAQRRELLAAQQTAAAELTELAHRLEAVQTPLLERLNAYEQRVQELEKELNEQSKENRELLKLKIDLLREKIESERSASRIVNFN